MAPTSRITAGRDPDHENIDRALRAEVAARYGPRIARSHGLKRAWLRFLMWLETEVRLGERLFGGTPARSEK